MEDDPRRTGRDGQTAREREAARNEHAFSQSPEGHRIAELQATITKLEAALAAQTARLTTMEAKQHEHTATIAKLEAVLRPRGLYQVWGTGATPISDWQDSSLCP